MKKSIILLIALVFCLSLTASELKFSLSSTIDSVLLNNQKIAQKREGVKQKEYLHKASISNYASRKG